MYNKQIYKTIIFITVFLFLSVKTKGQTDTLSIYFDFDKDYIKSYEKFKLSNFIIKNKNKINDIKLFGYADYKGSNVYNQKLSERRVDYIYKYLIKKGVSPSKITRKVGKGQVTTNKNNPKLVYRDRKVDIIYNIKKSCDTLISSSTNNQKNKKIKIQKHENVTKSIDDVSSLNVGDKILLENLYFIGGRHFITKDSKPTLKKLLKLLKDNTELKIEIQGHICCQRKGDGVDFDTGLKNLSVARAKYIYDYLIKNGINKNRLKYKGFGSSHILPDTDYMDPRNRRVEIVILDK